MMMVKYLSPQRSLATSISVLPRVNVVDRLLISGEWTLVVLLEACALSISAAATTCTHIWIDCCCYNHNEGRRVFETRAFDSSFVRAIDECVLLVVRLLGSLVLVCDQRIRLLSIQ